MSLPELVLALALAGGVALSLGHIITQVTRGVSSQENRSHCQTEAALAMLRLRSELRQAVAINTLTSQRISFAHPDVNNDAAMDVITYDWNGTAGSDLTRDVNGTGAETILSECLNFNLAAVTSAPTSEELLTGHVAYEPGVTSTIQEFATSINNYAAEVFTLSRSGASTFRISRVRVYLRAISAVGAVHVSVRTVSSGNPANVVEHVSRPISQLNPSGGWEDFTFGSNSGLTVGTSYAINVRCESTGGSVGVAYDQISGNVPMTSSDAYKFSTNAGSTWQPSTSLTSRDLKYLVYGRYSSSTGNALSMTTTAVTGMQFRLEAGDSARPVRLDGAAHCVNTPEQVQ